MASSDGIRRTCPGMVGGLNPFPRLDGGVEPALGLIKGENKFGLRGDDTAGGKAVVIVFVTGPVDALFLERETISSDDPECESIGEKPVLNGVFGVRGEVIRPSVSCGIGDCRNFALTYTIQSQR